MFVVKFRKIYSQGIKDTVISCDHYSKHERDNGIISIVTYKNHLDTEGVERHISQAHPDSYHAFFIENSSGKTIDSGKVKGFRHPDKGVSETLIRETS